MGHGATQTADNHSGGRRDFESVSTQLSFLSPTLLQSATTPRTAIGHNNQRSAKAATASVIGWQTLSNALRVIVPPPGDSAELRVAPGGVKVRVQSQPHLNNCVESGPYLKTVLQSTGWCQHPSTTADACPTRDALAPRHHVIVATRAFNFRNVRRHESSTI